MIPALAFATLTDVPELFNQLFMELPTDAYDLALYIESTLKVISLLLKNKVTVSNLHFVRFNNDLKGIDVHRIE